VKSNPVLSKVKEAIKIAKDFGADSVMAIGGAPSSYQICR